MEAISKPFESEARELHVWRESLYTYKSPVFQVDENLTFKLGYLFQDGTIAYSGRRREDMKFSIIRRDERAVPLLGQIGIKLQKSYKDKDSYVTLSYQDALYARRMLEELTAVKVLTKMYSDFQTFIDQHHDASLVETGRFLKVYSDIETIDNTGSRVYWPCFSADTFSFPLSVEGSTGVSYTYAVIPHSLENELILNIRAITDYIRGVRTQYQQISAEYA